MATTTIREVWNSLRSKVLAWWGRRRIKIEEPIDRAPAAPPADAIGTALEVRSPARVRRPRRPRVESATPDAIGSRWHFREDILDRLDEYFACMRRLRAADPAGYAVFSKIGMSLPGHWCLDRREVKAESLVTWAGVALPRGDDATTDISPSFIYCQKVSHTWTVEPFDGAVYRVTLVYDERRARERWAGRVAAVDGFTVGVNVTGGRPHLLRELHTHVERFHVGHGRHRHQVSFSRREWCIPKWIDAVAAEHEMSVEDWTASIAALVLTTHASAGAQMVVRASRGSMTASFGIAIARCKYFFADRGLELASDGRRKRIFHYVTPHDRQLPGGRTVAVREHYRGTRRFEWKGSEVLIVLPENRDILKFDRPGQEVDDVTAPAPVEMLTESQAADRFVEAVSV